MYAKLTPAMFTASFCILSTSSSYRSVLHGLTEREIIVMEGDIIFVNIDPNYNFALEKLNSLGTTVTNEQTSKLEVVQSDSLDNGSIFAFGGKLGSKKTPKQRASAFGRTASVVFRMVMLKAVQIDEAHWPKVGKRTMERNRSAMEFQVTRSPDGNAFMLLGNNDNVNNRKCIARKYWGQYDRVFPHFLIEDEVLENKGRSFLKTRC